MKRAECLSLALQFSLGEKPLPLTRMRPEVLLLLSHPAKSTVMAATDGRDQRSKGLEEVIELLVIVLEPLIMLCHVSIDKKPNMISYQSQKLLAQSLEVAN